jgi:hypothetical protein
VIFVSKQLDTEMSVSAMLLEQPISVAWKQAVGISTSACEHSNDNGHPKSNGCTNENDLKRF